MKSQKIIKETIKTEKIPQGQKTTSVISRKYKSNVSPTGTGGSKEYTVKETTIEKSYKKTYKKEEGNDKNNNINIITTNKVTSSSSSKQGANLGISSQNKISISNKEETTSQSRFNKYRNYKSTKNDLTKEKKYSKREIDMIIKIQKWWKRILARLNGYKIREKLRKEKGKGYIIKSREVVREKNYSSNNNYKQNNNTSKNISIKIDTTKNYKINNNKNLINTSNSNTSSYSNINSYSKYSSNNLQKDQNSKSYKNINNINSNLKTNLNINTNLTTSSSQNYIQTMSQKNYAQYLGSVSTSPSMKSKYIIETKKVEVFKRPKNYSANKTMSKNMITSMTEINRYEVKDIMKTIWNEESYCSTVESLCCLSDTNKSELSQNTIIFEEYEEEIRKLKSLLMEKDNELNNLMANLKETEKQMSVKYTTTYNEYNKNKNFDQDAHELQIISMKKNNWNEVNLPSPVSEIFIESFKTDFQTGAEYNMEKYTQKIRKEETQETISDSEAVLEIQEMNALSIISNKIKAKNICQHLQSLMILSKKNDEEEPLIFQKIEEINITSIPNKQRNKIQELDGLEIISMKKESRNIPQNVDKICIKSLFKKETHIMIQELDGFEILKLDKGPQIPQCVDELEIPREYDMLLVKPTWNSLQIQGSGLNLLAVSKDTGLENQEIDEFEILGKEKPKLSMQSLNKMTILKTILLKEKPKPKLIAQSENKITILKAVIPQKKEIVVTVPENSIRKGERFGYKGIKKKPEIKYIERFIKENKEFVPNEVEIINRIELKGEEKVAEVQVEEKKVEVLVEKKVVPNEIIENDRFMFKGKVKEEIVQVKRKGFVENMNKTVITKEKIEEKKEEPKKIVLETENIESIQINKEYETPQPIVLEKIDWNKMTRPIKSTKLVIKSIPHIEPEKEIEKEELVMENFAFNISETNKRFANLILFENGGFDLEGNKGIILKEGPAQTIQIKKEQILSPSKNEGFNIIHEIKKVELKSVNENRLQINSQYKVIVDPKENVKIIEKIIEKKINWNEFNVIEHNDFNLIQTKPKVDLIKQIITSILIEGEEMPQIPQMPQIEQKIIEKEKIITVTKDWKDLLQAQRNAKFGLLGKPKIIKKSKLLVANGDKFFIQKESDDEIIYNDDYNTRKQKNKEKKEEKKDKGKEIKTQIIKEKEIVPRHQREIRAQIARVKESESETSSLSDIDVLAGIRNRNMIGQAELTKIANGYETKVISGDVVYTYKNGLGVNLGGSQYQKQYKTQLNYSKKLSNSLSSSKMTGVEIKFNRNMKGGMHFEKMSATSGIISEGNYKILKDNKNNGQSNIKKQIIMTSSQNGINGQSNVVINNRLNQSPKTQIINNGNLSRLSNQKSASNILIKKRESNQSNESPMSLNINNDINQQMKIGNIVFNSKIKTEKGQYTPNSYGNMSGKDNILINSRKEYEKKVLTGDRNNTERIFNDKKKNIEIKFKKSKVKNVEPLRDYDSQQSY